METPELTPLKMDLKADYVSKLLGVDLELGEIKKLLEKMRYAADINKDSLTVSIPSYRTDILHPIDIIEDVAISFGYMNFNPRLPEISTIAYIDKLEEYCEDIRDIMAGYGFLEMKNLLMTSKKSLFESMNVKEVDVVEAIKPVSQEHGVARNWLLPSLMKNLEYNRNREYPQKIFEVGEVIDGEGKESMILSAVCAHSKASFSEIKSVIEGVQQILGLDSQVVEFNHPSFVTGRCAKSKHGFYGELHPEVLENYGLEMPVAGFELTIKKINNKKK